MIRDKVGVLSPVICKSTTIPFSENWNKSKGTRKFKYVLSVHSTLILWNTLFFQFGNNSDRSLWCHSSWLPQQILWRVVLIIVISFISFKTN
jgi:hypothetical protein